MSSACPDASPAPGISPWVGLRLARGPQQGSAQIAPTALSDLPGSCIPLIRRVAASFPAQFQSNRLGGCRGEIVERRRVHPMRGYQPFALGRESGEEPAV